MEELVGVYRQTEGKWRWPKELAATDLGLETCSKLAPAAKQTPSLSTIVRTPRLCREDLEGKFYTSNVLQVAPSEPWGEAAIGLGTQSMRKTHLSSIETRDTSRKRLDLHRKACCIMSSISANL